MWYIMVFHDGIWSIMVYHGIVCGVSQYIVEFHGILSIPTLHSQQHVQKKGT